jgi:hypothetical protein
VAKVPQTICAAAGRVHGAPQQELLHRKKSLRARIAMS